MSIKPPKLIAIDHDDYHAEFVGKTADGKQFFLTTPFVPASPTNPGNEFVALYLFDKRGNLIEALIDELDFVQFVMPALAPASQIGQSQRHFSMS